MHSDCLTDLRTIFSSDCIAARGFSKTARANSNGKAEILQTLFATQMWSKLQINETACEHAIERGGRIICHKNRFIRARRSRNYGGIGRKCIQSNSALCASQTELKQLQKTVKDTLEQLNQAKELQQKSYKKELERKQSNLHDYAQL